MSQIQNILLDFMLTDDVGLKDDATDVVSKCFQHLITLDIVVSSISGRDVLMFLKDRLDLFSFTPVCPVKAGLCLCQASLTIPTRGH